MSSTNLPGVEIRMSTISSLFRMSDSFISSSTCKGEKTKLYLSTDDCRHSSVTNRNQIIHPLADRFLACTHQT